MKNLIIEVVPVEEETSTWIAQILDGPEVYTFDAGSEKEALLGLLKSIYREFKKNQKTLEKIRNLC